MGNLSDRLEFVNAVVENDRTLASSAQNAANAYRTERSQLLNLVDQQTQAVRELNGQWTSLQAAFAKQRGIADSLASKRSQAESLTTHLNDQVAQLEALVSSLKIKLTQEQQAAANPSPSATPTGNPTPTGDPTPTQSPTENPGGSGSYGPNPLSFCPVASPHAFGDSFGAPRRFDGPHAGVDILSPMGTPVVAPYSGRFQQNHNSLGGNAYILTGSMGWAYGAHMSAYAFSAPSANVTAGEVIGYVGNTGDASGGPTHLHFEWHPNVLPAHLYRSAYGYTLIKGAIDPYPFLLQVC